MYSVSQFMYSVSQFYDRQMFAISVPPPVNEQLSDDFSELSRIHFYLGRQPIDFMIKAVEQSSLEEIEKGKIQIYFATKEIQKFLRPSWENLHCFDEDKLNPALYFDLTFSKILEQTQHVLDKTYKKPTSEKNLDAISTMISLTHEVIIINQELNKNNIVTKDFTENLNKIKETFEKVYKLKEHYPSLEKLKLFDDYYDDSKKSVIKQLESNYSFNYTTLTKIYEPYDGDWAYTLHSILKEQEKINEPDYHFNNKESESLKNEFLNQIKSFNRLLKNGVINYVYSYAASISKESHSIIKKSQISPESFFSRQIGYHESEIKKDSYRDKAYHQKELDKLNSMKDEIIKNKIDDHSFYESYLTVLHRQEFNIMNGINNIKTNLINFKNKETITFEGDIQTGFVVGTFSNSNKIILVHKDSFVNQVEAVYAMIMDKEKYNDLLNSNTLVFNKELREQSWEQASNFWNYGQFLQEINETSVQKFFLGHEFSLVDNTTIQENQTNRKKVKM